MSELTPRPDPQTPTRVTWECPNCQTTHALVEPRDEALETARNLLAGSVAFVALEDNAAAIMREQDLAERARTIFSGFLVEIAPASKRPWRDVRRYRKG